MITRSTFAAIAFGLLATSHISNAQYKFETFDIRQGTPSSDPNGFAVADTFLYFTANDGTHGRELMSCDGTMQGTQLVKDIAAGSATAIWPQIASYKGKIYFSASDGTNGYELWSSDGTAAGTQMLKDIFPGASSSFLNPPDFTVAGGKLYFTGNNGVNGRELWVSDGTAAGTYMVMDINPGIGNSVPAYYTEYNSKVYFVANDGTNGSELWVTDGTAAGTQMLKNIGTGAAHGYVQKLKVYNNKLYFQAYGSQWGLWESDGTTNGTLMVKAVGMNSEIALFNGKMYFSGANAATTSNIELFVSDGTANGTQMLIDIYPGTTTASNPEQLTVVGNKLFFVANDGVHQKEVWVTDGTTNGTMLVRDINTTASSNPVGLTAYGNKVFFVAQSSELWVSDGTSNGTVRLKWYDPVGRFMMGAAEFVVCNYALYFLGYDTVGTELWKLTDSSLLAMPCDSPDTLTISQVSTGHNIFMSWSQVPGATGYEYYVTQHGSAPGGLISTTANSAIVTGLTNGMSYDVCVRTLCVGGRSAWICDTIQVGTGVQNGPTAGALRIYPNPGDGRFTIDLPEGVSSGEVWITNMYGQVVQHRAIDRAMSPTFDLRGPAKGMYMVQVRTGTGAYSAKLVIQ